MTCAMHAVDVVVMVSVAVTVEVLVTCGASNANGCIVVDAASCLSRVSLVNANCVMLLPSVVSCS